MIKAKTRGRIRGESGQAMVETAICLPILLLIVLGILDFGWLFYNKLSVENASREGARYAAAHSASATLSLDVDARAKEMCLGSDADTSVTITIVGEDAVCTVEKTVPTLTPLPGIFTGGEDVLLSSETTMRVG